MIQKSEEEIFLKDYANNYSINELSSEDIIKLITKPCLIKEIAKAFNISEEDFKKIKKQKGITNSSLENIIRNIETILHYIDFKNRYVSNNIRKKVVNILIPTFIIGIPRKEFYRKQLSQIDFSREKVLKDLADKEIDIDYRLIDLSDIIIYIDKMVDNLLKQEKDFLLNRNNKQLYKQLCDEKKNGKIFTKEDLTYDVLFELAVIEGLPDSLIGGIYNLNKNQVRYLRTKFSLVNTLKIKIETYPEYIIYSLEKENKRIPNISNYEYEKINNAMVKSLHGTKTGNANMKENYNNDITVNINGENITYHVNFSTEKYSAKTKPNNRKNNGTRHNYKKENETRILHGKIGEKLILEAEKKRLINLGLENLAQQVQLIAQIDEETTFDGLGYDLISFNENGDRICIEVKTSYGKKDKPFFISKKELETIQGLKEEYDCKKCLIYYVLIDGFNVTIKNILPYDLNNMKLTAVLYKAETNNYIEN